MEWYAIRAGKPTASNFSKLITTKGATSTTRTAYMHKLVGEAILGTSEESYTNKHMEHGKMMEDEARGMYEQLFDLAF